MKSSWPVQAGTALPPLSTYASPHAIHICAPNIMAGSQRESLAWKVVRTAANDFREMEVSIVADKPESRENLRVFK